MKPQVDRYIEDSANWRSELEKLRELLLSCDLTEDWKWSAPCYTHGGANVALLGELKQCCVLSFPKGALLADGGGLLQRPGPNTQAARVIRFTSVDEIVGREDVLRSYLLEAMTLEETGAKVEYKKEQDPAPEELEKKLAADPELKSAFEALTPGRQRAYILHFSSAKQSATREARIDKCRQRILCGMGLNDCTCGHTRRPPGCDGSHKHFGDGSIPPPLKRR